MNRRKLFGMLLAPLLPKPEITKPFDKSILHRVFHGARFMNQPMPYSVGFEILKQSHIKRAAATDKIWRVALGKPVVVADEELAAKHNAEA